MRRAINAPSATNLTIVANTGRGGADPTQINAPAVSNLVSTNKNQLSYTRGQATAICRKGGRDDRPPFSFGDIFA